jgi:hypothetical protein
MFVKGRFTLLLIWYKVFWQEVACQNFTGLKHQLSAEMLFFYEAIFWTWSNDDTKQNIPVSLNGENSGKKKSYERNTIISGWSKHIK